MEMFDKYNLGECFDISFLYKNDDINLPRIDQNFSEKVNLYSKEKGSFLYGMEINYNKYLYEDCNYVEFMISISAEDLFTKSDQALDKFKIFIDILLSEFNTSIITASFEINGYLLSKIDHIDNIDIILRDFLFVFVNIESEYFIKAEKLYKLGHKKFISEKLSNAMFYFNYEAQSL